MDCSLPGSSVKGFPRQEYWRMLPFPSPGDLPNSGIEPTAAALAGGLFTVQPTGKPIKRLISLKLSNFSTTTLPYPLLLYKFLSKILTWLKEKRTWPQRKNSAELSAGIAFESEVPGSGSFRSYSLSSVLCGDLNGKEI